MSGAQSPLQNLCDPIWRCRRDRAARPFHRQPRDHPRPGDQNAAREALDHQGVACLSPRLQGEAPGRRCRSWTELFFLDEAVALAAGHRPCFLCRRRDAEAFRAAWENARGGKAPLAPEMDVRTAPRAAGPRPQTNRSHTWSCRRAAGWRCDRRGRPSLHRRARSAVPLDRARLSSGATNPSRRWAADPTVDMLAICAGYRPALHPDLENSHF